MKKLLFILTGVLLAFGHGFAADTDQKPFRPTEEMLQKEIQARAERAAAKRIQARVRWNITRKNLLYGTGPFLGLREAREKRREADIEKELKEARRRKGDLPSPEQMASMERSIAKAKRDGPFSRFIYWAGSPDKTKGFKKLLGIRPSVSAGSDRSSEPLPPPPPPVVTTRPEGSPSELPNPDTDPDKEPVVDGPPEPADSDRSNPPPAEDGDVDLPPVGGSDLPIPQFTEQEAAELATMIAAEKETRAARQEEAATHMQRTARGFIARRRVAKMRKAPGDKPALADAQTTVAKTKPSAAHDNMKLYGGVSLAGLGAAGLAKALYDLFGAYKGHQELASAGLALRSQIAKERRAKVIRALFAGGLGTAALVVGGLLAHDGWGAAAAA